MRKLPIFTVVNKMDRPALNGFEIIEQLEKEFQLPAYPVNWPIGSGDRFCGVFHRPTNKAGQWWILRPADSTSDPLWVTWTYLIR
jgi:peptide subunit release factor RF-3